MSQLDTGSSDLNSFLQLDNMMNLSIFADMLGIISGYHLPTVNKEDRSIAYNLALTTVTSIHTPVQAMWNGDSVFPIRDSEQFGRVCYLSGRYQLQGHGC